MAIKVIYFNMGGRAEPIRLALHYAGVQFEDVRLTGAEFGEKKAAGYFKFGQVPVVEIDGKQFAQSAALLTWAGKHSDLYPQDPI
jgi:glutathione S-transferase